MKPFGEDWDYGDFPLAYLVTFRTYGTWLHGDERGSIEVHRDQNKYLRPKINSNAKLESEMARNMTQAPFVLNDAMRDVVTAAIKEVCQHRGYDLYAINIRTNHGHVVAAAQMPPEPIANAFKSYATRALRDQRLIGVKTRPWSRGSSTRYLWKERHVDRAISYVL